MNRRRSKGSSNVVSLADAKKSRAKADPDAIYKAQQLMYKAFEEPSPKKRVTLAKKAISMSPGCADAYVILANETAESLPHAIGILKEGVDAAEAQLGPLIDELTGMLWLEIDARPYMRARAELAAHLWQFGEIDQAIEHYKELLRLNPNDNQGNRYLLLLLYVEMQKNKEAREILKEYADDDSAVWTFSNALLSFRSRGATKTATLRLLRAMEQNPYVAPLMLGRLPMPDEPPDLIGRGDPSEAVDYVVQAQLGWRQTPGALKWISDQYGSS